jgi:N-formylglutamate amidohydrolase
MSAVGAPTHPDPGKPRTDFNIGNLHGTTCTPEFMDFMTSTLVNLGHSVSVNFPYYGGELVARHGGFQKGVESVFIEVNKRLFIDTNTFKKTHGFAGLKASIDELLIEVVAFARAKAH